MKAKIGKASAWLRQNKHLVITAFVVALLFVVAVAPSAAQTYTLDLDTEEMKSNIFDGANVIVAALGAVMFLLAGFKLGGILIRGIVDTIGGIRF